MDEKEISDFLADIESLDDDKKQDIVNKLVFTTSCTPLISLRDLIGSNRTFSVPNYQRGYVWNGTLGNKNKRDENKPLDLFWRDLNRAKDISSAHYMGLISLKKCIDDPGAERFEVVDGQQRLTTCAILLGLLNKEITGSSEKISLCFADQETQSIFNFVQGTSNIDSQTSSIYKKRLKEAQSFFKEKLKGLDIGEKEKIKRALLDKLNFGVMFANEFQSSIVFETINNRGKGLTKLEILKNRIYYLLSLLTSDQNLKDAQAAASNNWKNIFENLGRAMIVNNVDSSTITDEEFLRAWGFLEFEDMATRLKLNEELQLNFILDKFDMTKKWEIEKLRQTLERLQSFSLAWLEFFRAEKNQMTFCPDDAYFSEQDKSIVNEIKKKGNLANIYLDKIVRLANADVYIRSCVVGMYYAVKIFCDKMFSNDLPAVRQVVEEFVNFLKFFEKYLFCINFMRGSISKETSFLVSSARTLYACFGSNSTDSLKDDEIKDKFVSCLKDQIKILSDKIIGTTPSADKKDCLKEILSKKHLEEWSDKIKNNDEQFFRWNGITYVLYELEEKARKDLNSGDDRLIEWSSFAPSKSIEHVFPQTPDDVDYWSSRFDLTNPKIAHSIGNLLPLKLNLNKKLQNWIYPIKRMAYINSSYMAKEFARVNADWNQASLNKRTEQILNKLKDRWLTFDFNKSQIDAFWNDIIKKFLFNTKMVKKSNATSELEKIAKHLLKYSTAKLGRLKNKTAVFVTIYQNDPNIATKCSAVGDIDDNSKDFLATKKSEAQTLFQNFVTKTKQDASKIRNVIAVFPTETFNDPFGAGNVFDVNLLEEVLRQLIPNNLTIYLCADFVDKKVKNSLSKANVVSAAFSIDELR